MTKRLAVAAVFIAVVALPMQGDFAAVARAIDSQRGVSRIWIPFLGIARAAVRVVEPKGVRDFQLATFTGADNVDPAHLKEVLRTKAGPGFRPLVQVWSKKSNEWSFIYARPSANGRTMELMVVAHDDEETVLVRVAVDAEVVAREIELHPRNVGHVARR